MSEIQEPVETPIAEATKKSKYQSQNNYHKKRYNDDPDYRKKKNEMVRKRNYERYHSDPAFAAKVKEASKSRTKKIMEIYKENKELFQNLSTQEKEVKV